MKDTLLRLIHIRPIIDLGIHCMRSDDDLFSIRCCEIINATHASIEIKRWIVLSDHSEICGEVYFPVLLYAEVHWWDGAPVIRLGVFNVESLVGLDVQKT